MRASNEISYDHTKAMRLDREHTCWPELGGALEAPSASQSAPRVPDFRDCRRNSGCRHFPDFYRASARDLAAAGDGDTCWRWLIQACPHGRGGRPILPTPVVAAIKGHPDTFWPFPPRKWLESTAITCYRRPRRIMILRENGERPPPIYYIIPLTQPCICGNFSVGISVKSRKVCRAR